MRTLFKVINCFISAIILLLAVVFIVVEGRLFFCGDWLVYDNVALGFIKYFFRFVVALFAATHSIFTFINTKKNSRTIEHFLFVGNISLFIFGVVLMCTATNYVGEVGISLSALALVFRFVGYIVVDKLFIKKRSEN